MSITLPEELPPPAEPRPTDHPSVDASLTQPDQPEVSALPPSAMGGGKDLPQYHQPSAEDETTVDPRALTSSLSELGSATGPAPSPGQANPGPFPNLRPSFDTEDDQLPSLVPGSATSPFNDQVPSIFQNRKLQINKSAASRPSPPSPYPRSGPPLPSRKSTLGSSHTTYTPPPSTSPPVLSSSPNPPQMSEVRPPHQSSSPTYSHRAQQPDAHVRIEEVTPDDHAPRTNRVQAPSDGKSEWRDPMLVAVEEEHAPQYSVTAMGAGGSASSMGIGAADGFNETPSMNTSTDQATDSMEVGGSESGQTLRTGPANETAEEDWHDYAVDVARGHGLTTSRMIEGIHQHKLFRVPEEILPSGFFNDDRFEDTYESTLPSGGGVYEKEVFGPVVSHYFCPECSHWYRVACRTYHTDTVIEGIFGGRKLKWARSDLHWGSAQWESILAHLRAITSDKVGVHSNTDDCKHHFHSFPDLQSWSLPEEVSQLPTMCSSMEHPEPIQLHQSVKLGRQTTVSAFLCCGCQAAIFFDSEPILGGTVPGDLMNELLRRDPLPGQPAPGKKAVGQTVNRLLKVLEKILFESAGDASGIRLTPDSKSFRNEISVDALGRELIYRAGFKPKKIEDPPGTLAKTLWVLPSDLWAYEGRQDVAWLRRMWVELQMTLEAMEENVDSPHKMPFAMLEDDLAPELSPKSTMDKVLRPNMNRETADNLSRLGCTLADSVQTIVSCFESQLRCDPINTPIYKDQFTQIAMESGNSFGANDRQELQTALALHVSSKDIPSRKEYDQALTTLQLTKDDFVDAYQNGQWFLPAHATSLLETIDKNDAQLPDEEVIKQKNQFVDALKTVATGRHDAWVWQTWKVMDKKVNGLQRAYDHLRGRDNPNPETLDEDSWLAYLAIQDKGWPMQSKFFDDWSEPYRLIGRFKGFHKLLAEIGDEVETQPQEPTPPGLYNIGNTCYLNSLLQYLYAVRPLKEAVCSLATTAKEPVKDISDLRIGGRLVSAREVERSLHFTRELAGLFRAMDQSKAEAVRPERDLAYLALVTASSDSGQDKAAEEAAPIASSGSDITMVADDSMQIDSEVGSQSRASQAQAQPVDVASPSAHSESSVLGKRSDRDEGPDAPIGAEDLVEEISDQTNRSPSAFSRTIRPLPARTSSRITPGPEDSLPLQVMAPSEVIGVDEAEQDAPASTHGPDSASMDVDPILLLGKDTGPPAPPLPPRPIPRASISGTMMFGQQNDVSETMDNCLFQLETAFAAASPAADQQDEALDLVKRLFYGQAKQQVFLKDEQGHIEQQPSTDVVFNNLILNVDKQDSGDLYDKLHDIYFRRDSIQLGGKQGEKAETLERCPPVLHMQLQRVLFDRATSRPFKSNAAIEYSESIFMDRFLPLSYEDGPGGKRDGSMAITQEAAEKKALLKSLEDTQPMTVSDALSHIGDVFETIGSEDQMLIADIKAENDRVSALVQECKAGIAKSRVELDTMWENDKQVEYELASVFMHRGQAGFGHYWLYQRDLPSNPDRWFQFNDETVRVAPKSEVFRFIQGDSANAYLLVYVLKDSGIIETADSRKAREQKAQDEEAAVAAAMAAESASESAGDGFAEVTPYPVLSLPLKEWWQLRRRPS